MMREVTAPSGFLMMTRRSLGSTGVTMRPPSGRSRSSRDPSLEVGQAAPQCTRSYWPCTGKPQLLTSCQAWWQEGEAGGPAVHPVILALH